VVPNTLGTRDPFCGEQFFHRLDEGIVLEWFKLVTFALHSIIITSAPPQLSSIRSQRLGSPALGNALAIQGLGLCTLTDKDQGSTPGLGTKMPQAMLHGQKEKKRERERNSKASQQLAFFWFLWYKYIHYGQFQASNMTSLNKELGRNVHVYEQCFHHRDTISESNLKRKDKSE